MPDEIEVSYTVKELLKGISDRIDGFMAIVGSKANQADVAHAFERIDGLDNRVTTIEHTHQAAKQSSSAKREFRRWAVPTLASLAAVIVTLIQVFHP